MYQCKTTQASKQESNQAKRASVQSLKGQVKTPRDQKKRIKRSSMPTDTRVKVVAFTILMSREAWGTSANGLDPLVT